MNNIGWMLFYKYISTCPRCKKECEHYLLLWDRKDNCDNNVVANGNCKCGYSGLVDLKYVGRVRKQLYIPINPNILDPS